MKAAITKELEGLTSRLGKLRAVVQKALDDGAKDSVGRDANFIGIRLASVSKSMNCSK